MASESQRQRVVIVGGGFGGLNAAKELGGHADFGVTLIDRRNHHLFQPLLYQVATGALSPADIAAPLRHALRSFRTVRVLLGEVNDLDLERRQVVLAHDAAGESARIDYDTLVIATGSQPAYFGHDAWAEHAPGLKCIEDATRIRARVLSAFEHAERERDQPARTSWMTFVVVGGGATGVELAGALVELARDTLAREFRAVDPRLARVILIEGGSRLLSAFPELLSRRAHESLERLGVEVELDTSVTEITADYVRVGKASQTRDIATRTAIWAAGVRSSPLAELIRDRAGVELDRQGRVMVEPDLSLRGHGEVFVIGDAAHCERNGVALPGVAPVAMQQGRYVGRAIRARARGAQLAPFRYLDKGNLAVIGRSDAVAEIRGRCFSGFAAWLLWLFVHLMYLVGFANRVLVLMQWAGNYFTRNRMARLITDSPEQDRADRNSRP